ncbi:MAG: hypothetical protein GVY25_07360 [Bacteroidetes bacterium]|jgi:hypothetical protein|nr:hypothetical protein [Bacteroidota bacterium]
MNRFVPRVVCLAVLAALLSTHVFPATAQDLTPVASESCDPAASTALYNPKGSDEAACSLRTYERPVADTLLLRQDKFDVVEVEAWDRNQIEVQTIVVARRASSREAIADLSRMALKEVDGVLEAVGPDGDGWWSVAYRIRVPERTTLAITSESAGISVRGVVGGRVVTSTHGTITFHLPAGAGINLQAKTVHGDIRVGFPVMVEGSISNQLETRVGEGGPTVRLSTKSGDVRVDHTEVDR